MYVHMYYCMYVRMNVCMYVCIYVWMNVCTIQRETLDGYKNGKFVDDHKFTKVSSIIYVLNLQHVFMINSKVCTY